MKYEQQSNELTQSRANESTKLITNYNESNLIN